LRCRNLFPVPHSHWGPAEADHGRALLHRARGRTLRLGLGRSLAVVLGRASGQDKKRRRGGLVRWCGVASRAATAAVECPVSAPISPCDHAGNVGLDGDKRGATCTSSHPGPVYSSARPASRRPPLTATSRDRLRSCCQPAARQCSAVSVQIFVAFPRVSSRFHPVLPLPLHARSEDDTARGVEEDPERLDPATRGVCVVDLPPGIRRLVPCRACVPGTNGARSSVKLMNEACTSW